LSETVVMGFSLDVQARLTGAAGVVARGDLDTSSAPRLLDAVEELLRSRPARVCLDLGLVTFADAAAISALIRLRRRCEQLGCVLVVERLSPSLQRTLETAGVLAMFCTR
jgi:anti-anti-sigma factor